MRWGPKVIRYGLGAWGHGAVVGAMWDHLGRVLGRGEGLWVLESVGSCGHELERLKEC